MSATPTENRLANESSLYLRQHAHNPVDWYPWGPEALARAKELDRPIFLSIGYSACHWCHVMEHESFEDHAIADLLNRHFVCIKVDREERPDLDAIYMQAVQILNNGQGGWPMSVFLTPDRQPFYAGTYFPPEDRYGRPGFPTLLHALIDIWQGRRADAVRSATSITEYLRQQRSTGDQEAGELSPELIRHACELLERIFDSRHGGFGSAPKFPHAMDVRLLLRGWKRFGWAHALEMARKTLDSMAKGGIRDHLGGGFARYSVDEQWLVPHFEKMLYDNALLTLAYLDGYLATGSADYRRVVDETLAYVLRDMTSPSGAFFSSEDADSEGEEGKFYVWSRQEVERLLGPELAPVFCDAYDVSAGGNFEGHNILHRNRTDDQEARLHRMPLEELRAQLVEGRRFLLAKRAQRVRPGRDEKILTAWNGLMIAAFAQAGAALDEPRYVSAAQRAAKFVLARLRGPDGRLLRTCGENGPAKLDAYSEDYACLIDALVSLYEADFDPDWLRVAVELADDLVQRFGDPAGGFFFISTDHEELLTRSKDVHDGSTPTGNAMAATALLRLAKLAGRRDLEERAVATLVALQGVMRDQPTAAGQLLLALDFYLGPVSEFAVIGELANEEVQRALRLIRGGYRPNKIVAAAAGSVPDVALLADKSAQGAVTIYVCENSTCQAPLIGAQALEHALHPV